MATASRTIAEPSPDESPPRVHRFTVDQYHRMARTGILTEDDRVELLEGWIVRKVTHNPPHDATISILLRRLGACLPDEWVVRVQSAITLPDSEPEPDLVVVRGPEERYLRSHPRPGDIALVIEVADASLLQDQQLKTRIYARARIPIYWIINHVDTVVEVRTRPKAGVQPAYRQRRDYGPGESVPLVVAGQQVAAIAARDVLPVAREA